MTRNALLIAATLLVAASAGPALAEEAKASKDASLNFVAPDKILGGIYFGLSAIDTQALVLDQRTSAHVASGVRMVWYTCPGETTMAGGSRLSFDFEAGKRYKLQCRSGQQARIVPAEGC